MTCILGIHDPDQGTVLACDGRLLLGDTILSDCANKILCFGSWVLGVSGHSATMSVLDSGGDRLRAAQDVYTLSGLIGELFRAADYRPESNVNGPPSFGQSFLVARADGLWIVPCNLGAASVPALRPCGIGSGGEWGEGAAWQALRAGAALAEAARAGVEAAIAYDSGCGGSVRVDWLPGATEAPPVGLRFVTAGARMAVAAAVEMEEHLREVRLKGHAAAEGEDADG